MATNGVTAMIAGGLDAAGYVEAVWDMPIPIGMGRYYEGILYLTALLILSAGYKVL